MAQPGNLATFRLDVAPREVAKGNAGLSTGRDSQSWCLIDGYQRLWGPHNI